MRQSENTFDLVRKPPHTHTHTHTHTGMYTYIYIYDIHIQISIRIVQLNMFEYCLDDINIAGFDASWLYVAPSSLQRHVMGWTFSSCLCVGQETKSAAQKQSIGDSPDTDNQMTCV